MARLYIGFRYRPSRFQTRIPITIRKFPREVRDELAARAALKGKSMQEFLRIELERLARRPPIGQWLGQVRDRKRAAGTRVAPEAILAETDADRR